MKKLRLVVGTVAFGLLAFSSVSLSAFPLTLTSLSGTITATTNYGADAASSANQASKVAVTLKQVITVLSNEVFLDYGTSAPVDLQIVIDPYGSALYLTNVGGFYYDIKGKSLGNFRIREIATTFSRTNPLIENDTIEVDLSFNGRQPNGQDFTFATRASGFLKYLVHSDGSGTINLSGTRGVGFGQFNSSDSGVTVGSFKARGTGTPEWSGPFSVFWWNF